MYGAVGFGCGIIGQGIANMIMTAKRYNLLFPVCSIITFITSIGLISLESTSMDKILKTQEESAFKIVYVELTSTKS